MMIENGKDVKELMNYSSGGILSKVIVKTDKNNVTLFCMAKGTNISEHTTTKEGFVYVVEGKGIFNLEGKDIEMLPGVFIYLQKNQKHSLKAEEDTTFILALS